uniref:DLEC1 cilia and flagella associated protein n=1 Tax=Pseudonaja textilis TaxID=8673 RepID=A0A670ZX22_PSETE
MLKIFNTEHMHCNFQYEGCLMPVFKKTVFNCSIIHVKSTVTLVAGSPSNISTPVSNYFSSYPTQDISHVLTKVFKSLYTSEVIAANMVDNMIKSRGGKNPHHEYFVEELRKLREEYNHRQMEALMLEKHIIQARARATAEEERILGLYQLEIPEAYLKSTFRWCVDGDLLKKHHLICPDDYITDPMLVTHKGPSGIERQILAKICPPSPNISKDRLYLQRLKERHNFLKNPRFFPPNSLHGGKSLILPQKKEDDSQSVPIFLSNPPAVVFTEYEVGQVYEQPILSEFSNKSPSFPGKFPGEGGLVAPGMSCFYIVQFIPEYLSDYDDYLLVESQAAYPLLVPLQGRRPPPVLTLPHILDCGACLVGGVKFVEFECKNEGLSVGKFCIMPKDMWPPPNFRSVATLGYVEQYPFGICPAVFELAPGQSIPIEVMFMPVSAEILSVTYITVCDNCHINEIIVTGLGEVIALELLSVSGGESTPLPGELIDLTSQHLVRFNPLNPHSMAEKTLIVRNITHIELPFFWQIVKPNLQSPTLEGKMDIANIKYNLDTETAFSVTPNSGTLQPHSDHPFTLCFSPQQKQLVPQLVSGVEHVLQYCEAE